MAAANEALAAGTSRPVVGKKVATTIEPACDYYLAEARPRAWVVCAGWGDVLRGGWACGRAEQTTPRVCLAGKARFRACALPSEPWLAPSACGESMTNPATPYPALQAYHQQYLSRGGRFGRPQSAEKGCQDKIRCYG